MFSWLTNPNLQLGGMILALIQVIAALPWLYALDPKGFRNTLRDPKSLGYFVIAVLFLGEGMALFTGYRGDSTKLGIYGRVYGGILHLQILIDLFIYAPYFLTLAFPKAGAVALAAYREGWRQPLFWLVFNFGFWATWVAVVLPYFTFGDDFKMFKQIGFDIIMLCGLIFGTLASSISIAEEIEGRTAITVMSKPISRRSFLIGKFIGILMACGALCLLLSLNLNLALVVAPSFDPINEDRAFDPMPMQAKFGHEGNVNNVYSSGGHYGFVQWTSAQLPAGATRTFSEGASMWLAESFAHLLGIILVFGQVTILVAIATALATRLPFVVNLVVVLCVYFFGHLAPVVVRVTENSANSQETSSRLIRFLAQTFDTLLPALEFFKMSPAIVRETPLDLWSFAGYVATVGGYSLLYTTIALLVGLLLFEDRDLA
jgi:ABC-type transport system involved in multi-copper enzyme maturation permease subunit